MNMNKSGKLLSSFPLLALLFYSCVDDFTKNTETVYYNPTVSFPVGPLHYTLGDIMPNTALGQPLPDTLFTDPVLIYDDSLYFENPEDGYDTIFTEPANIQSLTNLWEYVRSLMFRVNYSNGLPVNVATQLYFLRGGIPSDSLYPNGPVWIESAEVGTEGIVTSTYHLTTDTPIDSARIMRITQSDQIQVYLYLETYTADLDTLRVYSAHQFDVQIGIRAEFMIPH
jgi:hypothetical protein